MISALTVLRHFKSFGQTYIIVALLLILCGQRIDIKSLKVDLRMCRAGQEEQNRAVLALKEEGDLEAKRIEKLNEEIKREEKLFSLNDIMNAEVPEGCKEAVAWGVIEGRKL